MPEPHISKKELGQAFDELHGKGFSTDSISKLKMALHGDMDMDHAGHEAGISHAELDRTLKYMHENRHAHGLSDRQLETLKEVFDKKMKS